MSRILKHIKKLFSTFNPYPLTFNPYPLTFNLYPLTFNLYPSTSTSTSTSISTLTLIFTLTFNLISCQKDPEKIKKVSTIRSELGVERATGVAISYTDSGFLKAKIFAPLMERYPQSAEPYMEMKKGVKGYFYNRDGEAESSLTADYAISYENKKIIEVRNNVKVKNINNEEMETEKLIWDERRELIYTDNFIKIKTPDEILYGTGFEANQNFTRYRIKHLTGRVSIK